MSLMAKTNPAGYAVVALFALISCSSDSPRTISDSDGIDFGDEEQGEGTVLPDVESLVEGVAGDDGTPIGEGDGVVTEGDISVTEGGDVVHPDGDAVSPDGQGSDNEMPDETGNDETGNDETGNDEGVSDQGGPDEENPDEVGPDSGGSDDSTVWPDDDNEQPDSPTPICTPFEEEACPYTGEPGTEGVGPCKAGKRQCAPDGFSWSECSGEVLPSSDVCTDDVDNDCNGTVNDGYSSGAFGCVCLPNSTSSCYTGPAGTLGKGICHAGTATCNLLGTGYSTCIGDQTPLPAEICGNGQDDDCNGQTDENLDADGDGFGTCAGDCCDNMSQCADPAKVNPGAVEVEGDGVDNDCNGQTDENPQTGCSSGEKFSGTTATDLVYAMDICKHSTNGSWGIVGTPALTRAEGSGSVNNTQIAVMQQFGTNSSNVAIANATMASLSSGRARDGNDPDATTDITYDYYTGTPPADFIAPHGNQLPTTKAGCPNGSGANDGVMLSVQIKVPTNAQSFSFNFRFFSQEYWEYTCTQYNDFFIAMLYTGASGIPADKNISFDSNGSYISVNSDQFFTVCQPKSGYTCPDGTAPLGGTGYDLDYCVETDQWGECTSSVKNGGATKWLSTTAPVVPGETITLKFVIWDTSDQALDSLVLIDNFKWSAQGTSGPVTFECWDLNKNGSCDVATEDQSGDGICNERDC